MHPLYQKGLRVMLKKQLFLVLAGVAAILMMYFAGKTVQNKKTIPEVAKAIKQFDIEHFTDSVTALLPDNQQASLKTLTTNIPTDSVQKSTRFLKIADFWRDSAHHTEPYLYYISAASKLENSEKSLNFAARLMLDHLRMHNDEVAAEWMTREAADLFNRAIEKNPNDDDLRIGLGSTYIYGSGRMGNSADAMKGIQEILVVASKDSSNMKAQLVLGVGGMVSGQYDKARDRFLNVIKHEPNNIEAIAYLADTYAVLGEKEEAIKWYNKSKILVNDPHYSKEVDERINRLK